MSPTPLLVIGLAFWLTDFLLLVYYVHRYMKRTGKRPSVFTLFTIVLTLAGSLYNSVRLVLGPSPTAFMAMSLISTALAVFLFVIIARSLTIDGEAR